MLNVNKMKVAISDGKLTKKWLCDKTGLSRSNLDAILKGADLRVSTLASIAKALGRPIGYFFDEERVEVREAGRDYVERGSIEHHGDEGAAAVVEAELRAQIEQLRSQILDKERIIELLEARK